MSFTHRVASVGASGALFGLIGCSLVELLYNWRSVYRPYHELAKMGLMILVSLAIGLLPGVDNFSHLGGLFMGMLAGTLVLPHNSSGRRDRAWKLGAAVVSLVTIVVLTVLLLQSFYNDTARNTCPWCKYLSCVPIGDWCDAVYAQSE